MRTVPAALKSAALASQTDTVALLFLTITEADSGTSIRIVNDTVSAILGGVTYQPFQFSIVLPEETGEGVGDASLTIDAVDLSIITAIRTIVSRATASLVLADADDPDGTAVDLGTYELKDIGYDDRFITGSLSYEDRLDVLLPGLTFSPVNVPGVF